jgi:hypothetical protein
MKQACSNETRLGIFLGEGMEVFKNNPHGHRCRYPIDAPTDGSHPHRALWAAVEKLLGVSARPESTDIYSFLEG